MHFVTLDDDEEEDDGELQHQPQPAQSQRRASTHRIHDQIRLGLLPHKSHNTRSYSIGENQSNSSRFKGRSSCWIFMAGSVSTVAACAVVVAIFLLTLSGGNGGSSSNSPSSVQELDAIALGGSSIKVQWHCSTNDTIDNYQLEILNQKQLPFQGNDTKAVVPMVDNGLSCQTVVSQLNASTTYCFRIRAQSTKGTGVWNDKVQCNTTTTSSVPALPNSPSVLEFSTNTSHDHLYVRTTPPLNQGGSAVQFMQLQAVVDGGAIISIRNISVASGVADTKLVLDAKQRGELVLLSVSACNSRGCSLPSTDMRCIVAKRGSGPHAPPTAICSACEVGGKSSTSTVNPPSHPTISTGPTPFDALVHWDWGGESTGSSGSGASCGATFPTGFQLQRSDAWTHKTVSNGPLINITSDSSISSSGSSNVWRSSLANEKRAFTNRVDGLLPAMLYNMRVRAYTIRTQNKDIVFSKWSPPFFTKMKSNGGCGNAADVFAQLSHFKTMVGDIQSCMLQCIVSGVECAVKCVIKKIGLSASCAKCWGAEGQCIERHCSLICLKDPTGAACLKCTNVNCMPALEQCTGRLYLVELKSLQHVCQLLYLSLCPDFYC